MVMAMKAVTHEEMEHILLTRLQAMFPDVTSVPIIEFANSHGWSVSSVRGPSDYKPILAELRRIVRELHKQYEIGVPRGRTALMEAVERRSRG